MAAIVFLAAFGAIAPLAQTEAPAGRWTGAIEAPNRRVKVGAAANLITDLERFVDPVFVGEASSECRNLYGDPSPLVLPYSGISVP